MARITRADQQEQTRAALIRRRPRDFSEHGYGQASLDRIAEAAGFSRGAIYANFEGKPGLFLAVLDDRLQTQITELEGIGTDLQQLGRWRRKNARRERGLTLALLEFRALALREEPLRRQLVQRERKLRQAFAGLLTQAAEHLGITFPLPATDIATIVLALGDGITEQHLLDPAQVDPKLFEAVLATLISQLQPPA